jgi:hypothetical protein
MTCGGSHLGFPIGIKNRGRLLRASGVNSEFMKSTNFKRAGEMFLNFSETTEPFARNRFLNSFQRRRYFCIFPIWSCVNTMTCGGSHLGFPIGIKNRGPSNDHSWDCNSKMTTTAGHSFYIGPIVFFYNQVNDTGS